MTNTFEFIAIIYLIIGLLIFGNFAFVERKEKNISFVLIMIFGIFLIFLWPFYWPFFTTSGK